jgi:hypothetical protein
MEICESLGIGGQKKPGVETHLAAFFPDPNGLSDIF